MNKIEAIALGALLHDIGKFMERADVRFPESWDKKKFDEVYRKCCTKEDGDYKHCHTKWTYLFFELYKDKENDNDVFPELEEEFNDPKRNNIESFASYHHKPKSSIFQKIIKHADGASAGWDRQIFMGGGKKIKNIQMKTYLSSLFNEINKRKEDREELKKHNLFYELIKTAELNDYDKIFPNPKERVNKENIDEEKNIDKKVVGGYQKLWGEFKETFENIFKGKNSKIFKNNFDLFYSTLESLLEDYMSFMPSSGPDDIPDSTLFDHSKTTAAIAACLYKYNEEDKYVAEKNKNNSKIERKERYILLGGDLGGIQDYIFQLSPSNSKGISKVLRARSLYLSLLMKTITYFICDFLNLPKACILLNFGDKFTILCPNTDGIKEKLNIIQKNLDKWFLDNFQGELTFILNWDTRLCHTDFIGKRKEENFDSDFKLETFYKKIDEFHHNIESSKMQRLRSSLLNKDGKWEKDNFVISEDYKKIAEKKAKPCEICGSGVGTLGNDDYERDKYICDKCRDYKRIGKLIPKAKYLVYAKNRIEKLEENFLNNYITFDFKTIKKEKKDTVEKDKNYTYYIYFIDDKKQYLLKNEEILKDVFRIENISETERKVRLDGEIESKDNKNTDEPNIFCHERIANYIPIIKDIKEYQKVFPQKNEEEIDEEDKEKYEFPRPMRFDEIVQNPFKKIKNNNDDNKNEQTGKEMLGILKADVDNMGFIFSRGLRSFGLSISRYVTLSRMTRLFFNGYLNYLILNGGDEHKKSYLNIYTVYVGGDDILLVSDWETIIEFSIELQKKFREFTCENDSITLSAGISLFNPKFPIKRAAYKADELLEKSKEDGKNRLSLFETTVEWKDEIINDLVKFHNFLENNLIKNEGEEKEDMGLFQKAFLYRLLKYHKQFLEIESNIENVMYRSHMAYDVGRNILKNRNNKDDEDIKMIRKLYDISGKNEETLMRNLKIPLFWTLYKHRGEK